MRSDGNLLNLVRVLCGVEVFLSAGAKVDAIDSDRWTALHMASFEGDLPIVKVLSLLSFVITQRRRLIPASRHFWGKCPRHHKIWFTATAPSEFRWTLACRRSQQNLSL